MAARPAPPALAPPWPRCAPASIVTAALYTMCTLFLAAFQEDAYLFFSFLFHVDLQPGVFTMNWSVYAGGLVLWVIGMWLTVASSAGLYNALVRPQR